MMNFKSCSHNKLYTEPCDECELIYINSTLPQFIKIVDRMKSQREAIMERLRAAETEQAR